MNRPIVFAVLAAVAATVAVPALVTPAHAQIEVHIGTPQQHQPQRYGAWGDRDRDGVPNAYDRHDNRKQAWGDRDRDGRAEPLRHRPCGDGTPNTWDRNPGNPYWR